MLRTPHWFRALKNRLTEQPSISPKSIQPYPRAVRARVIRIDPAVREAVADMLAEWDAAERGEIRPSDVRVQQDGDGRWHAYVRLSDGKMRHRRLPVLSRPAETALIPADYQDRWLKMIGDSRYADRLHELRRSQPGKQV